MLKVDLVLEPEAREYIWSARRQVLKHCLAWGGITRKFSARIWCDALVGCMSHHLCSWVTDHNLIGYQCPLCLFLSSHRLLESKFNWISGSRLSCLASSLSSGNRPLNTSLHQLQWWESHFNWSSVSCHSLLSSFCGRYFLGYEHKGYIYVQAHVCLQSDSNQSNTKCRNMGHWFTSLHECTAVVRVQV